MACPAVTYTGRTDPLVATSAMASWMPRGTGHLGNCEFEGGHFFIYHAAPTISADLTPPYPADNHAIEGKKTGTVNIDYNKLADRYVAIWNEPDPLIRRKLIDEVWAEDGRVSQPAVHRLGP